LKTLSKILLLASCVLLIPATANAQKGLSCAMFQSGVTRNQGDEAYATAAVSKAGYTLTGGGCQVQMADGKNPTKPPAIYQNRPDGNRWLCRAHNDQGPIGAFAITAYAVGCGLE
jgi:hypothetical protein